MSFNIDSPLVRLFVFIRKSALITMLIITASIISGCIDNYGLTDSLNRMKSVLQVTTEETVAEGQQKLDTLKSSPNDTTAQQDFTDWLRNDLELDDIDYTGPVSYGEDYDEDAIVRALVAYYIANPNAVNATILEIIDVLLLGPANLGCSVAAE